MGNYSDGSFSAQYPLTDLGGFSGAPGLEQVNFSVASTYYNRMMLLYTTAQNTPGMPRAARLEAHDIITQATLMYNIAASLVVPPVPYKYVPVRPY